MISICMIVKDEADNLEKSLLSLSKSGYEIIVVDTGSKDNTKEIAYKFTEKVYDFQWVNDFSIARNFSISKTSNDYILVVDADEIIVDFDKDLLEKTLSPHKVGRLLRKNRYSRSGEIFNYSERVNRLFHKSNFEYEGSIHEQIVLKNRKEYSTYNIPIIMDHFGYEENEIKRKNKSNRNIDMLKAELLSKGTDPYILYQLGKSYYMDNNYEKAEEYFNIALEFDLDTKLEYVQDMVESLGYALINQKKYEDSMMILGIYDEFKNSSDFVFLVALIYMNNSFFDEAINEFKKAMEFVECKMEGVNDYLANYNIGVILECLDNKKEALYYYKKCKNYTLANERINKICEII